MPFMVKPPVPLIVELIVSVTEVLLTVMPGVIPPKLIVPPLKVNEPEADPKVMVLAFWVPDTVIVLVPTPFAAVPKLTASLVVVVYADVADVPKILVLQLAVVVSHVLEALPKPAVAPLVSQYSLVANADTENEQIIAIIMIAENIFLIVPLLFV